jgi:hypothetical protein
MKFNVKLHISNEKDRVTEHMTGISCVNLSERLTRSRFFNQYWPWKIESHATDGGELAGITVIWQSIHRTCDLQLDAKGYDDLNVIVKRDYPDYYITGTPELLGTPGFVSGYELYVDYEHIGTVKFILSVFKVDDIPMFQLIRPDTGIILEGRPHLTKTAAPYYGGLGIARDEVRDFILKAYEGQALIRIRWTHKAVSEILWEKA